MKRTTTLLILSALTCVPCMAANDILIADFEGDTYGEWKTTGTAFGEGWNQIMTLPRRLTLMGEDFLGIEPAGDIESLRGEHTHVDALTLPANKEIVLESVRGSAWQMKNIYD